MRCPAALPEISKDRNKDREKWFMNELTMELDGTSRTPLYEQIYNYIRGDIQCGKIEARQKLPSTPGAGVLFTG